MFGEDQTRQAETPSPEEIKAATEAAIEAAKEVGLAARLQGLAQVSELQEAEGWAVEEARPYPEGVWPTGEVIAEAEITPEVPGGRKLLYSVQLDPDGFRWHHGLIEEDGSSMFMTSVPAGVVISPDFARSWLVERTRKSREAAVRVEENARETLQQELLRKMMAGR